MKKTLLTPARKIEIKNKVKDSKFFGAITTANTKNEAKSFIEEIRDKHSDASHNVNAYRFGSGDNTTEYSNDDGEPAGSSGPPVLKAIKGADLTNTVIVVSRYFGGTKLGIGGLIRAYGNTARLAIKSTGTKRLELIYKLKITGNYNIIGTIIGQVESFSGKIVTTEYNNEGGEVILYIKPDRSQNLKDKLVELTGNKIKVEKMTEKYLVVQKD
jgi:uncharacterized YigZ family protein